MAGTCCGRTAARVSIETITQGLGDLESSIETQGASATRLARDPNCGCDPCMCPSDDVPCNARYLGNDLSDEGLEQALARLVRHARQIEAAQGDACDCADQPPIEDPPIEDPTIEEPPIEDPPIEDPPIQVPPIEVSPIEVSPIEVPPIEDPPIEDPEPRRAVTFFSLPPEVRNEIYRLYFHEMEAVLCEISAVRMRQRRHEGDHPPNRLARSLPINRTILDGMWAQPVDAPHDWRPQSALWQRQMAAITYEASTDDESLARFPGVRLGLLGVNRDLRQEAGSYFYNQNFRFTSPRDENIIGEDRDIFHGIMAADAFFRDRTPETRAQFTEIELDLGRMRMGQLNTLRSFIMTEGSPDWTCNWTSGLNRLNSLSNNLRHMPFQRLRLGFNDRPRNWYSDRLTVSGRRLFFDDRVPKRDIISFHCVQFLYALSLFLSLKLANTPQDPRYTETNEYPWTRSLFNIGPRNHLQAHIDFRWRSNPVQDNNPRLSPINNAIYMLRIIRNFMLTNAQAQGLQYEMIRVRIWHNGDIRDAYVEFDNEFVEDGDNSRVVNRLANDVYQPDQVQPNETFMADERPPPEIEDTPPREEDQEQHGPSSDEPQS